MNDINEIFKMICYYQGHIVFGKKKFVKENINVMTTTVIIVT